MLDTATADRIAKLPCWQGRIEIAPLIGGMTNRNFLVNDAGTGRFVVRVGNDLPDHGVMRFNELAAARAAHAAGISPEVVYATPGLLVSRYIDSHTLTPEDIRKPANLAPIIELVRRCHYDIPRYFRGPALAFWVFQVIRNYLAVLKEQYSHELFPELVRLQLMADSLERAVGPITLVFGHNDLLAANFLDDGKRLWLIDWDYAGFNSPLFDLANLSSNSSFDKTQDDLVLHGYFGERLDATSRRGFEAMKCASLLRETLWGGVSSIRPSIDFDYITYYRDYLARLDKAWTDFQSISR